MKLLYQRPKYLRQALRRARRNLKKRRARAITYRAKAAARVRRDALNRCFSLPVVTLRVPSIFSIVQNTKETLTFFANLEATVEHRRRVLLDMENCEQLDIDALLYILSRFHSYRLNGITFHIRGNLPKSSTCLALLMSSGFLQHVRSNIPSSPLDHNVLQIACGSLIDTTVAKNVVDFSLQHLKRNVSANSKAIYRILIEMMGNTREHAFVRQTKTSQWHLLAVHDKQTGEIRFAFLDGGQGVPTTIQKNFRERVNQLLTPIMGVISPSHIDARLLMSALRGEFRSKTGQRYRGKGMPEIYSLAQKSQVDKLRLVSGRGFVDCSNGNAMPLDTAFHGTLYTWAFR